MRIERTFIWNDSRPDDHDEVRARHIAPRVQHQGVLFSLRGWDVRYPPGVTRVTDATYDETDAIRPH